MLNVISIEDYKIARAFVALGASARCSEPSPVVFDRHELDQILQVYGRKVVSGEWRDYALNFDPYCASFTVIARASWAAQYRIIKWRSLPAKDATFSVASSGGGIIKLGKDLGEVLKVFKGRKLLPA